MIPRAHITAWRARAPWSTDAQIEQDLVICRAIAVLYSDELLMREATFRGGTALHKLDLDPPSRYSEDIDLVQVNAGPIGPVMQAIRRQLDPWLGTPQWKQGRGRVTLYYRFESETLPSTPLKLEVEINTREHFHVLAERHVGFEVDSPWWTGAANVLTYEPEELLGTKLRALFQRKKGRDLFDLSEALFRLSGLDADKVVACFQRYMEHDRRTITRRQFESNLDGKITDAVFLGDVPPLLAFGVSFDPLTALQRVRQALISRLPDRASMGHREDQPR